MALVEVRGLKKSYLTGAQPVEVLRGVDLDIERGEFVCLMGPSGSGKSTLLHLLGGLDRPSAGSVRLEGRAIADSSDGELSRFRRTRLGFIFQFFNLLPTLTALENASLPLLLDGASLSKVRPRALKLLERLGLADRAGHYPHQLSGGEMQRVAIARALVTEPVLVLADEPTGNLDSKSGAVALELLRDLARERQQTLLMVTHDANAASYGNRLVRMRDGAIEADALPVASTSPAAAAGR